MKNNKIMSVVFVAIGLIIIVTSLVLVFSNKNGNTPEKKEDLVYKLEKSMFYKEVEKDGKKELVDLDENDVEANYYFQITIPGNDYTETKFDKDNPYKVSLKNNADNFTFDIKFDGGKFLNYHDIIEADINEYGETVVEEDYKVGDTTVLRRQYVLDAKKHLEYYYLYKNGLYIEYSFVASKDYDYDYKALEKLFVFEIKEQQL